MSPRGGTTSTPMTRSTPGSAASGAREAAPEVARDPGHQDDPCRACSVSLPRVGGYLPSLRRCTRVFFSSLRCFFFAMRLRRFLMTEPTGDLSTSWPAPRTASAPPGARGQPSGPPTAATNRRDRHRREADLVDSRSGRAARGGASGSAGVVEALAEVLVDVVLDAPGTSGRPARRAAHRRGPGGRRSSWRRASSRRPRRRSGTSRSEMSPDELVAIVHRSFCAPASGFPTGVTMHALRENRACCDAWGRDSTRVTLRVCRRV